jgi:hypothetical protein
MSSFGSAFNSVTREYGTNSAMSSSPAFSFSIRVASSGMMTK